MSAGIVRLKRFAKYTASGVAAALAHLLVFSVASSVGVRLATASALGFCVAIAINYSLQYHWTFNYRGSHATAFRRYISVTVLSFFVNLAAFKILNDLFGVSPLLAQAIAIVTVFLFNFGVNSSYSFAGPKSRGAE